MNSESLIITDLYNIMHALLHSNVESCITIREELEKLIIISEKLTVEYRYDKNNSSKCLMLYKDSAR